MRPRLLSALVLSGAAAAVASTAPTPRYAAKPNPHATTIPQAASTNGKSSGNRKEVEPNAARQSPSRNTRPTASNASPGTPPTQAIAPILAKCQACHAGKEAHGGIDLSSRAAALRAVAGGPAIAPGNPAASRIVDAAAEGRMPPGNPLTPAEINTLETWVRAGAPWPANVPKPAPVRADSQFWSFQPVRRPALPTVRHASWPRNPIDRFVLAKLESRGLSPAPDADRRTWIRRVTFDLIGLPPTPDEIDDYVADKRPGADERVVDRLLRSPHYGERWGRHWLDVARFGESHGYEYDRARDNAWRYRDWVVDSLNADKPYDQFLTEQIAGDSIPGAGPTGAIATGFLVCGPSDEAGKASAGLLVRQRAREEEMEDMIGLVGQTALGLTVNCARCHDHKFDPIPMADYYRFKAALAGVQPGNRAIVDDKSRQEIGKRRDALTREWKHWSSTVAQIEEPIRQRLAGTRSASNSSAKAPVPLLTWDFEGHADDQSRSVTGTLGGDARVVGGRLTLPGKGAFLRTSGFTGNLREKTLETWAAPANHAVRGGSALTVQSADGTRFDGIVFGERQPSKWMAGSDFYKRTRDLDAPAEDTPAGTLVHIAITYRADGTIQCYRNGKPYGAPYQPANAPETFPGNNSQFVFGNRHSGSDGWFDGAIEEARVYDRALSTQEIEAAYQRKPVSVTEAQLRGSMSAVEEQRWADARARQAKAADALRAFDQRNPVDATAYAAVSTKPPVTHVLRRGDPGQPAEPVTPGALSTLPALPGDFGQTQDTPDSERRQHLARWLTDRRNPLTARVMVNRIWQGHFGRGIVGTPNDFGFNGERPTHPELLDWLAAEFVKPSTPGATPWSIKRLHRMMVLSRTYRQSGTRNPKAERIDADNRLLWRMAPRRIEGEAFRDSVLAVAGNLNSAIGGPSFRPFTVSNYGSDFYTLVDNDTPEFNRRSIYRMAIHSARSPLLEALDCPDPSTKTPRRTVTTTPIQALEMMNDSFVLRQARHFADRVESMARLDRDEARSLGRPTPPDRRISLAWRLAYGRVPNNAERKRAADHLRRHSLASLCWALFNSNEFLHVD